MKYVLYFILIYIAYLFIFRLVIPVYMASRKIKKGFREMQSKVEEQLRKQQGRQPQPAPTNTETKHKAGDYIDFEEVK